jgi:hypothetical protein
MMYTLFMFPLALGSAIVNLMSVLVFLQWFVFGSRTYHDASQRFVFCVFFSSLSQSCSTYRAYFVLRFVLCFVCVVFRNKWRFDQLGIMGIGAGIFGFMIGAWPAIYSLAGQGCISLVGIENTFYITGVVLAILTIPAMHLLRFPPTSLYDIIEVDPSHTLGIKTHTFYEPTYVDVVGVERDSEICYAHQRVPTLP